jgi:hypothetical protein
MSDGLRFLRVLVPGLILAFATSAFADTATFILNNDGTSSIGGNVEYGKVQITSVGSHELDFSVSLDSGIFFSNTGGHTSFAYNLATGLSVTSTINITPSYFGVTSPDPDPSFGGFTNGLKCDATQAKCLADSDQTLSFDITGTGFNVNSVVSDFKLTKSSGGAFFAADIIDKNVNGHPTGAVGANAVCTNCNVTNMPEARTVELLASDVGLIGVVGAFYLRRKRGVSARS